MVNDLGCQKIRQLVLALKRFWRTTRSNRLHSLNNPNATPEFGMVIQIINSITAADVSSNSVFQEKLISSSDIQELLVYSNKKIVIKLLFFPPKSKQIHIPLLKIIFVIMKI